MPKRVKGELYRVVAPGVLTSNCGRQSHEQLVLMTYYRCLVAYAKSFREGDWRECLTLPETILAYFTEEMTFEVGLKE